MKYLYGKPLSQQILDELRQKIKQEEIPVGFAVILIGDDAASHIYVNLKEKAAKEIGMQFHKILISQAAQQSEVLQKIKNLNEDDSVHGIIVQLPLPKNFDTQEIINAIDPRKDVDGFHPENVQMFEEGRGRFWPVFPHAIIRLAESSGENLQNKSAVVIANSKKFGEVMRSALQQKGIAGDYILAKSISQEKEFISQADILITALGKREFIAKEYIKEGAIVIDGGISKKGNKVFGDVNLQGLENNNGFISPVPGGVGPMTIACLLENVYMAFKAQQK